jgi:hypothetical protein
MTPDNFKSIEDFILFSKAAQTRSGAPFICETFAMSEQKNNPITAKGKVFVKGTTDGIELPIEMTWSMQGNALSIGDRFDLIKEEPFEDAE